MVKYLTSLNKEQQQKLFAYLDYTGEKESSRALKFILKHYNKLGAKGILAWDYCRYVSLCRWGYVVGFLEEKEAWDKILYIAPLLQKTFNSWAEMGENYIIGFKYWGGRRENQYSKTYQKLTEDPASTWNLHPWNLTLD